MVETENRRQAILKRLQELNTRKDALSLKNNSILEEIKEKVTLYNRLIETVKNIRESYQVKKIEFEEFKDIVKRYRKDQRENIKFEYIKKIQSLISEINLIKIEFKLSVFKKFDIIKAINTEKFENLNSHKLNYINEQKIVIRTNILDSIKETIEDELKLNDLIFNIGFIVKFENYFDEVVFIEFVYSLVKNPFLYHFASDRESNRMDKPEWFFDYLLEKYQLYFTSVTIYDHKNEKNSSSMPDLIKMTQSLIYIKIKEILKCKSEQKRNLTLHFVKRFKIYSEIVENQFGYNIDLSEIGYLLSKSQTNYINNELSRISELNYMLWFENYRTLCKDCIFYIKNYRSFDKNFQLFDLISGIISYTKSFIENLRFINRDEVKAICFLFSEFENLKNYIQELENEILVADGNKVLDISTKSLLEISNLNYDIMRLIKKLVSNDVDEILKKIQYFNFTSTEVKRVFVVNLSRFLEDYKYCVYFDLIERLVFVQIDDYLYEEILLKIRFSNDEYSEFLRFYKNIKEYFSVTKGDCAWRSDKGCTCIEAIFEGKFLSTNTFKKFSSIYNKK